MVLGTLSKTQVYILPTAGYNTSASATTQFDVSGYDQVVVKAIHPAVGTNTTAKWAALDIRLGNDTTFANSTTVPGLQGTSGTPTSTQFALPTPSTAAANVIVATIANNHHKNLHIGFQAPGATGYNNPVFVVEGYRGGQAPNTTTELGVIASVAAVDTLA